MRLICADILILSSKFVMWVRSRGKQFSHQPDCTRTVLNGLLVRASILVQKQPLPPLGSVDINSK